MVKQTEIQIEYLSKNVLPVFLEDRLAIVEDCQLLFDQLRDNTDQLKI